MGEGPQRKRLNQIKFEQEDPKRCLPSQNELTPSIGATRENLCPPAATPSHLRFSHLRNAPKSPHCIRTIPASAAKSSWSAIASAWVITNTSQILCPRSSRICARAPILILPRWRIPGPKRSAKPRHHIRPTTPLDRK